MYADYNAMRFGQNYFNPYNQKTEIVKVNGRNGAEAFVMPPNSSALLLDESAPVVWLKMTDGAGYPTITAYNITPVKDAAESALGSLEKRIEKLEAILNDKPDNADVKSADK